MSTARDLVVLVADANAHAALSAMLQRHRSLGIRPVSFDVFVHPERDPGCRLKAHGFLRAFQEAYVHALVLFDREGCGREEQSAGELEAEADGHLHRSGWGDRAKAIVLDPELDVWVWSPSPHVDVALGWRERRPSLRQWLVARRFLAKASGAKPDRPKEALEAALRDVRRPRSSAIYGQLARKVGLASCRDRAFLELQGLLRAWFPPPGR